MSVRPAVCVTLAPGLFAGSSGFWANAGAVASRQPSTAMRMWVMFPLVVEYGECAPGVPRRLEVSSGAHPTAAGDRPGVEIRHPKRPARAALHGNLDRMQLSRY